MKEPVELWTDIRGHNGLVTTFDVMSFLHGVGRRQWVYCLI